MLDNEMEQLKKENQKYKEQIDRYIALTKAVEEKERRYDQMLTYLEAQKLELQQALDLTKRIQRQLKEEIKKIQ